MVPGGRSVGLKCFSKFSFGVLSGYSLSRCLLNASRVRMCPASFTLSKKVVKPMIISSFCFSEVFCKLSKTCLSFSSEAVSSSLLSRLMILSCRGLLKLRESLAAVGDLLGVFVAEVDMLDGARVVYVGTAKSETWLIKGSTWV